MIAYMQNDKLPLKRVHKAREKKQNYAYLIIYLFIYSAEEHVAFDSLVQTRKLRNFLLRYIFELCELRKLSCCEMSVPHWSHWEQTNRKDTLNIEKLAFYNKRESD